MAEDQVRAELDTALRDPELKNSVKAHVRARLLSKLRGNVPGKTEDLTGKVVRSLVLEYLRKAGLEFTISVFLPESGAGMGLEPNEMAQLIGISSYSPSESLLSHIVTEYQRTLARPHLHESACQTEDYKAIGHLEDRLHSVEMQYLSKMKSLPDAQTMEERMLQYQRDCESRLRLEMDHEVARIREVETQSIRLEETSKYRQQLLSAREELESQWNKRVEQLKDREKESNSRMMLREKDLETQLYMHRQQVLRDMELLRAKEQELKRQSQVEAQAAKLEKDTWEARRLEAESKSKELDKIRLAYEHKAEADFEQFKREYETRHLTERHKVMDEQADLDRAKRSLKDEQERINAFRSEFSGLKQELAETRENLQDVRREKEKLGAELRTTQEQLKQLTETGRRDLDLLALREQEIAALKTEIELFRDMLEESKSASKVLDERHREVMTHMNEELQRYKRSTPEGAAPAMLSTEMTLRWRQLERDEEELKRQALDWIKPAYRQGRSPGRELYAPRREPLVAEPMVSMQTPIRVEQTMRAEERKNPSLSMAETRKPEVRSEVPAIRPVYIQPEIPQEQVSSVVTYTVPAATPPPTETVLTPKPSPQPVVELPPPVLPPTVLPPVTPEPTPTANPVSLPPSQPSIEEPDLAEYELRQQRRRQMEFFGGEESEGSSTYSDRFE